MRHAGAATLDALEPWLAQVRVFAFLTERQRGVFYRGARAWLHFHEDPAGTFADVKSGGDWLRIDVTGAVGRDELLRVLESQAKP
ncbi:MAG: hypothetical protein JWP92_2026 [Caulobacter sp.]|nr:hypothetical protein [Caulobacter sp.]